MLDNLIAIANGKGGAGKTDPRTALGRFVLLADEAKKLVEGVLHRSQPRPSELTFRRHRATLARGTTLGCGGVRWTTP